MSTRFIIIRYNIETSAGGKQPEEYYVLLSHLRLSSVSLASVLMAAGENWLCNDLVWPSGTHHCVSSWSSQHWSIFGWKESVTLFKVYYSSSIRLIQLFGSIVLCLPLVPPIWLCIMISPDCKLWQTVRCGHGYCWPVSPFCCSRHMAGVKAKVSIRRVTCLLLPDDECVVWGGGLLLPRAGSSWESCPSLSITYESLLHIYTTWETVTTVCRVY